MQIVVLDGYSVNPGDLDWSPLKKLGTLSVYDRTHPSMVAQRLRGADAVLINKVRMTREVLMNARQLKFIGELATGYDNIDLNAARERGITVCNVPAYSTEAVAQLTIAMLLDLTQRASSLDRLVHQGNWTASPDFCYWDKAPILLDGMTFGVIGTGRIGCRVAKIAQALGMRVIGYSRNGNASFCGEQTSFAEVLARSDVLSLHCPATAETIGMIRSDTIAKMKDGAILINTARGSLINEYDVAAALQSGKLSAFAADVVSTEPISKSNPLLMAPNCLLTPHYAWSPVPTRQKLIDISVANLTAFLNGTPIHVVS
ncbi:MAG: D-2-hydroxyacid dehydrogenase [Clostridia bacterium]|nr:D-2-hydroxyacid dehydrogenase [Clostridia bacterium]